MVCWMSKSFSHFHSGDPYFLHRCIPRSWREYSFTKYSLRIPDTSLVNPISQVAQQKGHFTDSPLTEKHLIHSLCISIKHLSQGQLSNAFKRFSDLQHLLSTSTLTLYPIFYLLLSCTSLKALPQGKQLHAQIISLGFDQRPLLIPKLVTFYTSFSLLTEAHIVAEDSKSKNVLSWNVLISAYVRDGYCRKALSTYKQMVKNGFEPDNYTFPSILKACAEEVDLDFGREIHRTIKASGLEWNLFVHNTLVSMYAKCGSIVEARALFDRMPGRDVVSWNAIISGYASKGMWKDAFELFERLRVENIELNSVTYCTIAGLILQKGDCVGTLNFISQMRLSNASLDYTAMVIGLSACSHIGFIKSGKEIHGYGIRIFCDKKENVVNSLITMYSRCKDLKHAYILFQLSEERDVITWNCIIAGFAHLDQYDGVSFLFRELISLGVEPNYVTIASILPLCARIANLQHGKELHCYIIKRRFEDHLLIWNSVIYMYSKSGQVSLAQRVFKSMRQKDEVSYTSLIAGYGVQGNGEEALELFNEMTQCGIKPDHVIMVSVLSACSHSGLVMHGEVLFGKMIILYGLMPKMEHFSCMVDLFGRAGLIRKAQDIISRMPFQPSPAMWTTLIGACRIHRNMEIGEWAAEKLLSMRPDNPGYYTLVANMYAAVGRWNKLAEVRTLMRDLGLRKDPGCAWVDVGIGFVSFVAGDRSCPQADDCYELLYNMPLQTSEGSYMADEDSILEDG